jgi:hypothetical protein
MFIADLDGETQYTSEDLSWADRDSYRFVRRISTDKRTSSDRPTLARSQLHRTNLVIVGSRLLPVGRRFVQDAKLSVDALPKRSLA